MSNKSLLIRDLSVAYGATDALDSVNFELHDGEIVGIVGESGSGKSTLLNAIMGTLPEYAEVTSGSIELNGRDMLTADEQTLHDIRGAQLGVVFQDTQSSLCPVVKIRKHFKDALKAHGAYDKETFEDEVLEILRRFGLKDGERLLDGYPFELSGGMAQRVCIALACMLRPSFVLADEPTSALDSASQVQVISELKRMRDGMGVGVLLITHNMGVVSRIADKVGVCYAGQLVEFGPAAEVLIHPLHPYTQALIAAIPKIGHGMPQSLPGRPPSFDSMPDGCRFAPRCRKKGNCSSVRCGDGEHWYLCSNAAHEGG
jgi:oligopeptide/dipeptide ABC transporter ATP-binding protein